MMPVADCATLQTVDRSCFGNPMLSSISPIYQTSLRRVQPLNNIFYPYIYPTDNGFNFEPLLNGAKSFPILSSVNAKLAEGIEKSNTFSKTSDVRQQSLDQSCQLSNDRTEVSCQNSLHQMNGPDDLRMTGSSNQRAEQLSWLAEVATGAVSSRIPTLAPSSPDHEKNNSPATPIHLNSDPNSRTSLGPILLGSATSNSRIYSSFSADRLHLPPPTQHSHQTSAGSSSGLSLYYSQAPRNTPYTNFYHTNYRSSMPYSCITDSVNTSRLSRPYFQSSAYASTLSNITSVQLQNAQTQQLPHSPGYLPSAAMASSPIGFTPPSPSSPHGRISLSSNNRQIEEQITQNQNTHLALQMLGHRLSPQFHQEDRSYKSPDLSAKSPVREIHSIIYPSESPTSAELKQNSSPSQVSYKIPTGKEGSLKHRILRPPSINIVEPPHATLEAPLSAPPIRTHREPSPKHFRNESYRSISTSSSFFLSNSQAHTSVQQDTATLNPTIIVSSDSATLASNSPNVSECGSQNLKYPAAFMKGSIIQLANSQLKPVEQMTTEDFLECEALSSDLKIDSSTVVTIEKMPSTGSAKLGFAVGQNKTQITVEAPLEHPFFVYKQGWSSCSPERSLLRYGLTCHKLKIGDTCIFLTVKSDAKQTIKSSFIVPTNHTLKSSNSSISVSLKTSSKCGLTHRVGPSSVNCSLTTNSKKKPISQKESKNLVPLLEDSSSKDTKSDEVISSGKRKRRWSAPGQVTVDQSSVSS